MVLPSALGWGSALVVPEGSRGCAAVYPGEFICKCRERVSVLDGVRYYSLLLLWAQQAGSREPPVFMNIYHFETFG